ncbi:MAG: hypothetical protein WD049_06795, partial [Candidatus Paceibacterota bacterium]
LNQHARALVAQSGLLHGPTVNAYDRIFQAGDRAVCLKNRNRLGVLNGDLATVTAVDPDSRTVTLKLDRNDSTVTVPRWYIDEGNLDWGYALTGHKAQGATARRAHTVAGDGVDREWLYVTMSRGREANTIYLTDPDLNESECTHLTHQHPERLPALISALGRTAAEPAASDSGRGPRTLADQLLIERIEDLGAELGISDAEGQSSAAGGDEPEFLVEYLTLQREAHNRHRDRLAVVTYQPPEWITNTLGERPVDHDRRVVWDAVVDRALRYRTDQQIPDDATDLLGVQPPSRDIEKRVAWIAVRRALQGDLLLLTLAQNHERSVIGR